MATTATKSVEEPKMKNVATVGWFQQCVHRSRNEIFSEMKTITPAMAEVILSQNHNNRSIRPTKLSQMVRDMAGGRWKLNGEPIIVAKTGELNDGQHRLTAIVESKAPQVLLFVFGVDRETRTTVDQGANRGVSDYIQMDGGHNATTLASITRHVMSYEHNGGKALGRPHELSSSEVLERALRDKTLQTSAKYADDRKSRMKRYCSPTVIGICHNILLGENATDGLAFMEQLCSGENLKRGEPIFTLREKLLDVDRGKTVLFCVEVIFRAWNAYRERRPMRTIPFHGRLPELV
jgi:hypothetical protein